MRASELRDGSAGCLGGGCIAVLFGVALLVGIAAFLFALAFFGVPLLAVLG